MTCSECGSPLNTDNRCPVEMAQLRAINWFFFVVLLLLGVLAWWLS